MINNPHKLLKDLGSITFEEKEYKITEIATYESGNQVINLVDIETGEEVSMTFWKSGY